LPSARRGFRDVIAVVIGPGQMQLTVLSPCIVGQTIVVADGLTLWSKFLTGTRAVLAG
jgi:hypothetical protein